MAQSNHQSDVITDFLINFFNKLSYTGGGISIGSLMIYKEQLSLLFGALALLFTVLTFFVSLYFQIKRDRREELEEQRKELSFEQTQEERRKHCNTDNGERRRDTDFLEKNG